VYVHVQILVLSELSIIYIWFCRNI